MMFMKHRDGSVFIEGDSDQWQQMHEKLRIELGRTTMIARGRVHAQDVSNDPQFDTYELPDVMVSYRVPTTVQAAQDQIRPNLPWAEDHFVERVGGKPLNPAPSEQWWPFRQNGNAAHKEGRVFSHTYPERMWPVHANRGVVPPEGIHGSWEWGESGRLVHKGTDTPVDIEGWERSKNKGIRYEYGDLNDVIHLLRRDPFTRQAYLPIWFPEDTGAIFNQRVPCSLGYHFIRRGIFLDCIYTMRSCDFFRHMDDDAYLAVRLLQWVCEQTRLDTTGYHVPQPGQLKMNIANLHAFRGDTARLQ